MKKEGKRSGKSKEALEPLELEEMTADVAYTLFGEEDVGHKTKWGAKSLEWEYPVKERIKKKTTSTDKRDLLGSEEGKNLGSTSGLGRIPKANPEASKPRNFEDQY